MLSLDFVTGSGSERTAAVVVLEIVFSLGGAMADCCNQLETGGLLVQVEQEEGSTCKLLRCCIVVVSRACC